MSVPVGHSLDPSSATVVANAPVSDPPAIVPPIHTNRTLVLCFDGTGDQFDDDNSNIVQLFSMLKKDDRSKQMVYYQAGIGTYTSPEVATPLAAKLSKTLDEMVAWSLDNHVISGYEFLMQNYDAGDRICIFGFSRGAYTARALAGMIHKVGLLPAFNYQQVPFAYKMYTRADDIGWQQSTAFKRAFSIDVDIEFIGVWDTVNSVGIIPRRLPFTTSNTIVRTFRHAVALDEHRAKFKANLWNRPTATEQELGFHAPAAPAAPNVPTSSSFYTPSFLNHVGEGKKPSHSRGPSLWQLEAKYGIQDQEPTNIDEVWFSGCHCDVGGGSVANGTPHTLARISLRWMIRECFKTSTGIMFEAARLREIGMDPTALYPVVLPRPPPLPVADARLRCRAADAAAAALRVAKAKSVEAAKSEVAKSVDAAEAAKSADAKGDAKGDATNSTPDTTKTTSAPATAPPVAVPPTPLPTPQSEEHHELHDALSPDYDQLGLRWHWWILELFPIRQRYQRGDDSWVSYIGMNLGRARFIPKQRTKGLRVHRSVKLRMEAEEAEEKKGKKGAKYRPKPEWFVDPTWVD